MLDALISSGIRVKLLIKFFLDNTNRSYLKELDREYSDSKYTLYSELASLEKAGLLSSELTGNRRYYRANQRHPFYSEIVSIVRKTTGIDHIIGNVISRSGDLKSAWVTGTFARGIDSGTIELVLSGNGINTSYIDNLIEKAEKIVKRKIMYIALTPEQAGHFLKERELLLIWTAE